jgi:predicted kinase
MRPGIVMLVGRPAAGKTDLAAALVRRLPDLRMLDRDAVEGALFEPSDDSAAERSIAFSAVLDAARYHLGRGRLVAVGSSGRRGEGDAVRAVADEAGAFVATIVCAPAEVEPSDDYLTVDTTRPVDEVVELALDYIDEIAQ